MVKNIFVILVGGLAISCSAQHAPNVDGPQQAVAQGAIGAGTGAIIGNQLSYVGEGAAIGGALGVVSGLATGLSMDQLKEDIRANYDELKSLEANTVSTRLGLEEVQAKLDYAAFTLPPQVYSIYFDPFTTSLKLGGTHALERIADVIKANPYIKEVSIEGHTDDGSKPEDALRESEARARTVQNYLAQAGVATDKLKVKAYGSSRPQTSNTSAVGRQFNRRVEVVINYRVQ